MPNPFPIAQWGGRSTLLDGLVAYWKLDEASGNRLDSVGANHLAPTGSPGNALGKVGNALALASASSQSVGVASNAVVQAGDIDFSFSVWIWLTTKAASQAILCKRSGAAYEYDLYYGVGTDRLRFFANGVEVAAATFGSPALATWLHLYAQYDSVANLLGLSVNNGTLNTAALATGGSVTSGAFAIGTESPGVYFNGRIDEVAFYKRVLTAAERTALYNAGNGLTYPFS